MKKSLFIAIVIVICVLLSGLGAAYAQKPVGIDQDGNYVSISKDGTRGLDKMTGKFYVDNKGIKYAIYESVNGKLYYYKTAKTSGHIYKVYIKVK